MENTKVNDELIKEKLKSIFHTRLEDLRFNSIEKSEDLFILMHETLFIEKRIERLTDFHDYIFSAINEATIGKNESLSTMTAFNKSKSLSNCLDNKTQNTIVKKNSWETTSKPKKNATPNKTFPKFSSEQTQLKTKFQKHNSKRKLYTKKTNINEDKLLLDESISEQMDKTNSEVQESNNVRYLLNKNSRKTQDTFENYKV